MRKPITLKTVAPLRFSFRIAVCLALCALLVPSAARADLTDPPVPWSVFVEGANVYVKSANGEPLHDYETSADPSSGGTGVGADNIDIGSEWNGIDDPTAPHELCNPELSASTANGRCGTANSAYWGYYDGGTPYDPDDPTTGEDDVIYLKMRLVDTPAAGGGALDFSANHWNFLIDTDFDGYKDYWLDLDGGFNRRIDGVRIDHIQVLYEPTDIPEIDCGGENPTQLVEDPDDARVAEFTACSAETTDPTNPCVNSHTRVTQSTVSGENQYFLEVQLPLTALKNLDCVGCPTGPGGISCQPGQQIVWPLPDGAPNVSYLFSTGNSGVDPLQKDYIADCDLTGNPPDGPCSFPDATPVSLASVSARMDGSAVTIDWTTATQTATVGYNVYAVGRRWRRLNDELIPAGPADSLQPLRFRFTGVDDADAIGIEDVDVFGRTRRHGPFAVGADHGRSPVGGLTDWAHIRTEVETGAPARAASTKAAGWTSGGLELDLVVDHDGVYRVTYEDLGVPGFGFDAIPAHELALVGRDGPVPILVTGGPVFGPGSTIEFVGEALYSLYTRSNRYRLVLDERLARRTEVELRPPRGSGVAPWYTAVGRVENQRDYSFSTPVADPWFDTSMVTYTSPREWTFDLEADHLVADAGPAELTVRLWGGTDWPDTPDHHVVILVNGIQVADQFFDGLTAPEITATVSAGVLEPGANTLTIRLPGDTGVAWDVIRLDGYELRFPRRFTAAGESTFDFTAAGDNFEVDDVPDRNFVIYSFEPTPTRITGAVVERTGSGYAVSFGGTKTATRHLITADEAVFTPVVEIPIVGSLPGTKENDLLIIAHPHFIGGLDALVSARRAEGLAVEVVNLETVYERFSRGVVDPLAIRAAIADSVTQMGTRFVLLVGGDTFDYHDHLGLGSVSFIPSIYGATDRYITHAPLDPLYGDVDNDGVPEVAIGRFPVRTLDELDRLVAKTLAFDGQSIGNQSAVIAADVFDSAQDLLFTGFAERIAGDLPPTWAVARAYVDSEGFAQARATLIEQINGGAILTGYVGHSGPTMWSFDGLLHVDDIAGLTNIGRPTLALQWGCWNTYYVEPRYDSIGMALLLHGDQGAAAVLGATSLSWVPSANAYSGLLAPAMVESGRRIGDAITSSKQLLAATHPDSVDVVLGWTLLGDPTLILERGSSLEVRR